MQRRARLALDRLLATESVPNAEERGRRAIRLRDYQVVRMVPVLAVHVAAVAGFFVAGGWSVWVVALALFGIRMFGVTAGYHRYFSHRSFKTGRAMQLVLALLAESSSQRGVLWWSSHHRAHHRFSDTDRDIHSPEQFGFWHAHLGWLYDRNDATEYERVKDLARYPELVVLDKLWVLPPFLLALGVTLIWGLPGLLVGFALSTVLVWHATFSINSLAHVWGRRRYETDDTSRNNWFLALISLGEGWHNNHHHFMGSARQGFRWWELDVTYYGLLALRRLGLIWDLKEPPAHVVRDHRRARAPT